MKMSGDGGSQNNHATFWGQVDGGGERKKKNAEDTASCYGLKSELKEASRICFDVCTCVCVSE